jgi:NADPH-dependent glutamate synthase beta subunit-like oxidoreductase
MSATEVGEPVFEELRPPLSREAALLEADRCLECGGPMVITMLVPTTSAE